MPTMNDSLDGQTQYDPQAELLARAASQLGFQLCEFEPDECDCCHKLSPLYFQGPIDAGRYMCGVCVVNEYQQNERDYEAMVAENQRLGLYD